MFLLFFISILLLIASDLHRDWNLWKTVMWEALDLSAALYSISKVMNSAEYLFFLSLVIKMVLVGWQ